MAEVGDDDPAVRILLEQNQGRHIGQAYKRANKEAEVRIREAEARMKIEIREQVEQQTERIHQQAFAEALMLISRFPQRFPAETAGFLISWRSCLWLLPAISPLLPVSVSA